MADIRLNVVGDGSSGSAVMDKAAKEMADLGNAAKMAGAAFVAFGAHALKSFADSERVTRQLTRASGEYSGALQEQAKALSQLYAIDDDLIMQSQTLLAQWGGAGAAAQEVEVAALNLASALGTDLNGATQALIRNVESGGVGLAKMGIHFESTGRKGDDLAAAVAAINAKLGGAAAADANSLTGQASAARVALGDLEKGFGELIAAMVQKSGTITWVRDALASYQEVFFGNEEKAKSEAYTAMQEKLAGLFDRRKNVLHAINQATKAGDGAEAEKMVLRLRDLDAEIAKLKQVRDAKNEAISGSGLPGVTGQTNKGRKDAEAANGKTQAELDDISLENAKAFQRGLDEIEAHADERAAAASDRVWATVEDEEKARQKSAESALEFDRKMAKEEDERRLKTEQEAAKIQEQAAKDAEARVAHQAQQWRNAGDQIGAAFVNALSSQLESLAEGGEFDVAVFVGDILASAVAIAGTVIGSAYGQPELGAALGNLAAMGVRAGAGAISKSNKKRSAGKMHDGGLVGDEPRYHDGGMIAPDERRIIAQTGEFMWSREMVRNAGGPQQVEHLARNGGRGGPNITNYIQAIDSKNAAESFMADLGQGMKRAIRTGHGDVPRLLGNPR